VLDLVAAEGASIAPGGRTSRRSTPKRAKGKAKARKAAKERKVKRTRRG